MSHLKVLKTDKNWPFGSYSYSYSYLALVNCTLKPPKLNQLQALGWRWFSPNVRLSLGVYTLWSATPLPGGRMQPSSWESKKYKWKIWEIHFSEREKYWPIGVCKIWREGRCKLGAHSKPQVFHLQPPISPICINSNKRCNKQKEKSWCSM